MKTRLSLLCLMFFALSIIAQSPEKMSYQAIIFNSNNNIVVSQDIGMKVSLIKSSIDGTIVYTETHSLSSNANGMVSLEIGTGTTSDDFSSIDWSDGPYFIKTETDPTQAGGTDYSITGITQLLSVPYALYAKTAGSVTESDPVFSEAAASNISNEDISNWNNKISTESDPLFSDAVASGITSTDTTNWNNKISTESDPLFSDAVASGITTADTSNWNNKLDTESDPLFSEAVASGITSTDTTNWNNKISTESDPLFSDAVASGITTADTSNWNNKLDTESDPLFSEAVASGITSTDTTNWNNKLDTESDPVFTAWDKDYADLSNKPTIVNSQWTSSSNDIYYNSGSIGIGTETPNGSAILDLSSTSKGFLPPRLTTNQRDAITGITPGLLIFNTTDNKLQSVTPSDGLTLDQSNEVYYTYSTMNYQSFTAGTSGKLSKVSFRISNPKSDGTGTVKLFIYEGEKIEGGYLVDGDVLLGESAPVVPVKDYTTWCDFDLSSLDINLSSGQVYTMKLLPSVEEMTWIAFDNSNAYAGGRCKISSSWDLLFKTYMEGYAWTNVQATSSNSSLSQGKLFIGNASNEASEQSITGDVTISEAGVTSIGTAKVTNDMLAGSISNDKLSHPSPWTTDDTKLSYSSGNVGIGTTSPNTALDIKPSSGDAITWRNSDGVAMGALGRDGTPDAGWLALYQSNGTTSGLELKASGNSFLNGGNVGIGITQPDARLTILEDGSYKGINVRSIQTGTVNREKTTTLLEGSGGNYAYHGNVAIKFHHNDVNNLSGDLTFWTKDNSNTQYERMRIAYNGNVGIGTTTPENQFAVGGVGWAHFHSNADGHNPSTLYNYGVYIGSNKSGGASEGNIAFHDYLTFAEWDATTETYSERMRIDGNGKVCIGTTNSQGRLTIGGFGHGVAAGITMIPDNDTQDGHYMTFTDVGYTTAVGSIARGPGETVVYNTSSDYRLKENVVNIDIDQAKSRLMSLRPVEYNYISDETKTVISGFLAHEMADAGFTNGVTGEKDAVDKDGNPIYQAIDTKFLIPEMVKVIQEQQTEIDALKKELDEIDELRKMISELQKQMEK